MTAMSKEAQARIKINKLLEAWEWLFLMTRMASRITFMRSKPHIGKILA
jgi:hypothetical protein